MLLYIIGKKSYTLFMKKKEIRQWISADGSEIHNFIKMPTGKSYMMPKVSDFSKVYREALDQLDLAQNTGWRKIYSSFAKSTELNRNQYVHGALMFWRRMDGKIVYSKIAPVEYSENGLPLLVRAVPLFKSEREAHRRTFTIGRDAVIWYDVLKYTNTQVVPISRMKMNSAFIKLQSKIIGKMESQLDLSGFKLVFKTRHQSMINEVKQEADQMLHDSNGVIVIADETGLEVDPNLLTFNPDLPMYMQMLQDINQTRQYLNGFGQGAFGTFKKERSITGEIDNNLLNTNLVNMARIMLDEEWVEDMRLVLGEEIFIEHRGGNM